MQRTALVFATLILAACSASLEPIVGCEQVGDIKPYCNMQTPEDIAALPDGRHLLLAHFGHMGESSGSISLFDTQTETTTPLFPLADNPPAPVPANVWGQADCTEPPNASFGPHGTHLHQLADGRWRYLVVNHGDREAVEIFELLLGDSRPALEWRGCVVAGDDTMMNDVVGLTDGDLVYSRMFGASDSLALLKSLFRIDTGELWRWSRETGLKPLPATAAAQPNGLEISADNRHIYANMYMEQEVWKVRLPDGEIVARYPIANADNSSWGSDGRLWIATHTMGVRAIVSCFSDPSAACPGSFAIVALDTETGKVSTVFAHEGAPMGAATVAVAQAGRVYMGSFAGDRMIAVPDFVQAGHDGER